MTIAVLNRIILASSNPGDLVLDPFNGSGTTTVAAALLGRRYVGIDQSEEYVGYARKRLQHAMEQAAALNPAAAPGSAAHLAQNLAVAMDPSRQSKVRTETDAFGRPRVERRRRAKTA